MNKGFSGALLASAFILVASAMAIAVAPARAADIPGEFKTGGFAAGCQSYSFNRFTAFEAIEKCAEAGGRVIEFYPGQRLCREEKDAELDHHMSDAQIEKLKAKLAEHGVKAVNYGVVWLGKDEKECRKVFDFAAKLGAYAVTSEPDAEALDLVEKLVKEYDIRLAIHNHPRRLKNPGYRYWDPEYVLSVIRGRDKRVGACADTGHWIRSGVKPIEALRVLRGRIVSSHLKDLNAFSPDAHDVPFGLGVAGIGELLRELERQNFAGNIAIEYEHNWDGSVPEIAQCIGFIRGFGAER